MSRRRVAPQRAQPRRESISHSGRVETTPAPVYDAGVITGLSFVFVLATAAAPPRVLVVDFQSEGASEAVRVLVQDEVAARVTKEQLDVLTMTDLRNQLDVEAEKRAVGCTDESCLIEIASALGAEYTIYGRISTVGGLTVVNITLLDARRQVAMGRESAEAHNPEELLQNVRLAAQRLVAPIAPPKGPPILAITGASVAGLGFLATAVGAALCAQAYLVVTDTHTLAQDGPTRDDKVEALGRIDAGALLGGVGLGVLVGGGILALATME